MTPYKPPSAIALGDRRNSSWVIEYGPLFLNCPQGESFEMPLSVGKESSLRSTVSRLYNSGNKKFKVVKHEHCYEVYRKV